MCFLSEVISSSSLISFYPKIILSSPSIPSLTTTVLSRMTRFTEAKEETTSREVVAHEN
jgi:hypothetical protein